MRMGSLLVIMFVGALSACAPVPVAQKANPVVVVRCVYPVISPQAETKELQGKGGINISLAPSIFTCADAATSSSKEIPRNIFDFNESYSLAQHINSGAGGRPENYRLVETTQTPIYVAKPDRVAFRVKINNQMPRVFRGAGTVVLYNFAGRNRSVSSQDYTELTNLIVPPRTEAEVMIYGPSFQDIPENAMLGIFLYDVVTKTDNAGNIVEKQNFEWYYKYQTQAKEAAREVTTSRVWVRR